MWGDGSGAQPACSGLRVAGKVPEMQGQLLGWGTWVASGHLFISDPISPFTGTSQSGVKGLGAKRRAQTRKPADQQ